MIYPLAVTMSITIMFLSRWDVHENVKWAVGLVILIMGGLLDSIFISLITVGFVSLYNNMTFKFALAFAIILYLIC